MRYPTGFYINEKGILVDLIGWREASHEYEVIGVYESKELEFSLNIRKQWED
jgi:hypothetical protein